MTPPANNPSLGGRVYEQLRERILAGEYPPGSQLPAERLLAEILGVNRGAVREALKRLEEMRLVSIRHGGGTTVLDYREGATLGLLPALITRADGSINTQAMRGVIEMRTALAADAARLAALRGGPETVERRLRDITAKMGERSRDLAALQQLAMDFWDEVVALSENVAYRLAFNTLRESYDPFREVLRLLLSPELQALDHYRAITTAISERDEAAAEQHAREVIGLGAARLMEGLRLLDQNDIQDA